MQAPIAQQPVAQAQAIPQQMMGAVGMAAPMAARPNAMMNPLDAIKSCLQHTNSFVGRASRSEFWWFYLFYFIVSEILSLVAVALDMIYVVFIVYLLVPAMLSIAARRLHDHGKSGWFMLIPFYNLYLFIVDGEGEVNKYGAPPTNVL